MVKLSEIELNTLIQGGETNVVELKVAAPRATETAERLCAMANAQLRSARMPLVNHGGQVAYS